jgi:hypothetical protein
MQVFRVQHDYDRGVWIKGHPRPIIEISAASAKQAAEQVCEMTLQSKGLPSQLRAKVWPLSGVRHQREIGYFYSG